MTEGKINNKFYIPKIIKIKSKENKNKIPRLFYVYCNNNN